MVTENNSTSAVSIIMATYNRAHLIGEALRSIQDQSFKDWECLVIDDGSTDNTRDVVKAYHQQDSRIKYFLRDDKHKKGLPGSRNFGLNKARGEYIIFFDDDDIVHPDNLKSCIYYINLNPEFQFCRYDKEPFPEEWLGIIKNAEKEVTLKKIDVKDITDVVTGDLPFASCTVMWRKDCFQRERFNENLMYAEEWELYSRILSKDVLGVSINKVLYFNRKHRNSNTGEFWNNDQIRKDSYVMAIRLVIHRLKERELLSNELVKFFLQLGFFLKSKIVIETIIRAADFSGIKKSLYLSGFIFYPLLRPFFVAKGKIIKTFKGNGK